MQLTKIEMAVQAVNVITVPIDDTLTTAGAAADAKAVGDALALKADKSELQASISVDGQTADAQGHILVYPEHISMSGTDPTTLKAKITAIDNENHKISLSMRALIEPKEEEAPAAEAVEDAFRYGKMVLCAASYDGGLFSPAYNFIHTLQMKSWQNRKVALVENGTWAPSAGKVMKELFGAMKDVEIVGETVTLRSRMKDSDLPALDALADAILK